MKLENFHLPHFHFHLGLVPAESRRVRPMPMSLKGLVPMPTDNNRTLKSSVPDTERDTMPLIIDKAKRTAWQVAKLAEKLKGATLAETLRNDSNFVLDYIKYKKDDPLNEQIRSPRRLVWEGAGDCDCFSVFLAALLINQGIKFKFRIAKYEEGDWAHIYVIVPNDQKTLIGSYTTLDPVTNRHNYEVPYKSKKDYDMSGKNSGLGGLQYLDGIGDIGCSCGVPGSSTTEKKKKSQVVSAKGLQIQGLESATNLISKTGLPYTEKTDTNGNIYYDVIAPNGSVKSVAGFIPMDPAEQQKITSDLMDTTAPAATTMATSNDLTAQEKKTAWKVLLAISVASVAIGSLRSSTEAKGVGALPRKKIAYMKI